MLYASITLSWCVFSRDYCIAGQLKSNISLGITKTVLAGLARWCAPRDDDKKKSWTKNSKRCKAAKNEEEGEGKNQTTAGTHH